MVRELEGCAILQEVFEGRGYRIAREVALEDEGVSFTADGWDAEARVGFEYMTHEAGDHEDLDDAEITALGALMARGALSILIIDESTIDRPEELEYAAHAFLDAVEAARAAPVASVSVALAIAEIAAHDARVVAEIGRLDALVARHHDDLRALQRRLSGAWVEVGARLLPDLEGRRVDALAADLELPSIASARLRAEHDADRRGLRRAIDELDARPELGASTETLAECEARIGELDGVMVALQRILDELRGAPFFEELCDVEYDTPHYPHAWWTFTFYRHRRRGDALVEALGAPAGITTFAGLRRRYEDAGADLRACAAEREACTTRMATLRRLIAARADAEAGLEALGERHLARARARVIERLQGLGAAANERLGDDPERAPARAKLGEILATSAARVELERLYLDRVEGPRAALAREHARDHRDLLDLGRAQAPRALDRAELERRTADPSDAWARARAAFEAARSGLIVDDVDG